MQREQSGQVIIFLSFSVFNGCSTSVGSMDCSTCGSTGTSTVSNGSSTSQTKPSNASKSLGTYEVIASDLSVRTGPGENYRRKTYNEFLIFINTHQPQVYQHFLELFYPQFPFHLYILL